MIINDEPGKRVTLLDGIFEGGIKGRSYECSHREDHCRPYTVLGIEREVGSVNVRVKFEEDSSEGYLLLNLHYDDPEIHFSGSPVPAVRMSPPENSGEVQ